MGAVCDSIREQGMEPVATMMSESDPRRLVDAYLNALASHDYERARGFLADTGFSYSSPITAFTSADDFMQHMSLAGAILQRIEPLKVFVDGPDVCHFVVFVVQLSEKQPVKAAQWARVEDGRIQRIEVLFDAHIYRSLFEPQPGAGR